MWWQHSQGGSKHNITTKATTTKWTFEFVSSSIIKIKIIISYTWFFWIFNLPYSYLVIIMIIIYLIWFFFLWWRPYHNWWQFLSLFNVSPLQYSHSSQLHDDIVVHFQLALNFSFVISIIHLSFFSLLLVWLSFFFLHCFHSVFHDNNFLFLDRIIFDDDDCGVCSLVIYVYSKNVLFQIMFASMPGFQDFQYGKCDFFYIHSFNFKIRICTKNRMNFFSKKRGCE